MLSRQIRRIRSLAAWPARAPRLSRKLTSSLRNALTAAVVLSCAGGKDVGPAATPAAITAVEGMGQSVTVNTAVATRPGARVTDTDGNVMNGVSVTFNVSGGGGSVSGGTAVTGTDGIARVGSWTLGTTVGTNTLTAAVAGVTPATFSAAGTPGAPATIATSAGTSQVAVAGAAVVVAPQVVVRDQFANVVPGAIVTFSVTAGGGNITGAVDTTDAGGHASVGSWTLGTAIGTNTLSASVGSLTPVAFNAQGFAGPATSMLIVAGQGQSLIAQTAVPIKPAVRVRDANLNPAAGQTVTFSITQGGGGLSGFVVTADSTGLATVGGWSPASVGTNKLRADAGGGVFVDFIATGNAGTPKLIAVNAGNNQVATVNKTVAVAPAVKVTDSLGNGVPGATVTFNIGGGAGSLTGATPATDSSGFAAVGSWKMGTAAGTNTLTATLAALTPAGFSATAVSDTGAASSKFAGDAQSAAAGVDVAVRPAVKVVDQFNNPVKNDTVLFTVTQGGGSVTVSKPVTDSLGIARVGSWKLGNTPGANQLTATVPARASIPAQVFSATGTAGPAIIIKQSGDNQTATVAAALPVVPVIKLTDALNNPTAGVVVTFVPSGSGNVPGVLDTTDAGGIASPGVWTISQTAGANALTVTVLGLATVDFNATGTADVASKIDISTGNNQTALVSGPVTVNPRVIVRDQYNNPVSGMGVTFAVASGGGAVTGASQTTASTGLASPTSWTMGPGVGANTLTATSASALAGSPVTFTASAVTSSFNIDVRFLTSATASQMAAFANAAQRWQTAIIGDIPAFSANFSAGLCFTAQPAINEVIDDVIIYAEIAPIDGVGGILGQAGPCFVRASNSLTIYGHMLFDSADLANLETSGQLQNVITHEMAHVLGFGSVWGPPKNLTTGTGGGSDPIFIGAGAVAAFLANGGGSYPGTPVPLENTGAVNGGTRDSHWRETVLKNELMTGFLNAGANPLSVITIQSFGDVGYTINLGAADAFTVSFPLRAAGPIPPDLAMGDDMRHGPIYSIDDKGRIRRIR